MTHENLINGSLATRGLNRGHLAHGEFDAVCDVLMAAEKHGFGNMICWLATGWAQRLRENGAPLAEPEDMAGGRCYPLPAAKS